MFTQKLCTNIVPFCTNIVPSLYHICPIIVGYTHRCGSLVGSYLWKRSGHWGGESRCLLQCQPMPNHENDNQPILSYLILSCHSIISHDFLPNLIISYHIFPCPIITYHMLVGLPVPLTLMQCDKNDNHHILSYVIISYHISS